MTLSSVPTVADTEHNIIPAETDTTPHVHRTNIIRQTPYRRNEFEPLRTSPRARHVQFGDGTLALTVPSLASVTPRCTDVLALMTRNTQDFGSRPLHPNPLGTNVICWETAYPTSEWAAIGI